jgi:hypothetical protein
VGMGAASPAAALASPAVSSATIVAMTAMAQVSRHARLVIDEA